MQKTIEWGPAPILGPIGDNNFNREIPSVSSEFLAEIRDDLIRHNEIEYEPFNNLWFDYSKMEKAAIRLSAYYAWENAGRPEGMADHFWLEAEKYHKTTIWI